MNLFKESIFEKYTDCYFFYKISIEKHSESIYLVFCYTDDDYEEEDYEKEYALVTDAPILSNWLTVFGYDDNEPAIMQTLLRLKDLLKVIPIEKYKTAEDILAYLRTLTEDIVSEQIVQIFEILKPIIETYPLLSCIYAEYYRVLDNFRYVLKHPEEKDNLSRLFTNSFKKISNDIKRMEEVYAATREYCKAVFQTDNAPGGTVSPKTIEYIYQDYCEESDTVNYSKEPIMNCNKEFLSYREAFGEPITMSWEEYYEFHKNNSAFSEDEEDNWQMSNLEDIAYAGMNYLSESESVLRTCKLCGREFRTKYTSSQEYCTRLYGDTKAACNEYASRKSYKEKLFKHPIHQEFTRAYNKLYGRIRRGRISADTPLMDQLKRLHEEYYDKYENTHFKEREEVWKEYIEKNKELIP